MRNVLAITGASGFVGRMIVPRLAEAGIGLLLAGRDIDRLRNMFPGLEIVGYDDLSLKLRDCGVVFHLAVLNNDQLAPSNAFRSVNVDFLLQVAEMSRDAAVPLFINATTLKALDARATDPYSVTKREGEIALARICGMDCVNLRLPAVYGEQFTGRLAVLNRLPPFMRSSGLAVLSAFRPVVKADRVAETVVRLVNEGGTGECIVTDPQDDNPVYRFLQRAMDLSFVLVVALAFWWLFILVWAAIRLTSPGAAIFAQPRIGRHERVFTCYKFRTMRTGSPQAGTHEVSTSYVTPVGRVLRRTKIDELPQILNVLRGEMSLVGPRPCLPGQTELVEWRRRLGVFACRPGITGLAQVAGVDMSEPERLARMDARYCAIRTITLDIRLAIRTLSGR